MYPNPSDITRVAFSNGLTVLVRENHAAPVAVLQGSLAVGSMYDAPEQAGLAGFVGSMLTRGSRHYTFAAFNEAVESVGGNLTFGVDTQSTDFGITCLSEDFADLLTVLADALRRPTFETVHADQVRQQRLVDLQERDEDTASTANLQFYEALYGREHAYGRSTSGYRETVAALQRDDLFRFYESFYTPDQGVIVVTGDVDTQAVLDLLGKELGDWHGPQAQRMLAAPQVRETPQRVFVPMNDKVQSDIVIGAPSIARSHPDYYAVRVANCILGQFGLMGRLGARVREEQGLAYYAYSTLSVEQAAGIWLAGAGVNPKNVEQAIASIEEEFVRIGTEGVDADELADSQAYLTGVLPLTLETNEGVAGTLLSMEWYGLGLDYLLRYKELIYAVSTEDIQRVCAEYLQPQRCVTVVAGPMANTETGAGAMQAAEASTQRESN
jgi:zinc protease